MVAVVFSSIAKSLTYSVADIKDTLDGKWGRTCQKDLLCRGADVPVVQHKSKEEVLHYGLVEELRRGEWNVLAGDMVLM